MFHRSLTYAQFAAIALLLTAGMFGAHAQPADDESQAEPLRIIVFGAHPDDCEIKVGGVAALWAEAGHKVKFVAVTNGDIGHHEMAGGPLAQRRTAEVEKAAEILGIESVVLDNHDGELMPTLEIRKDLIRLVREWQADVVISHRPNDYHPDHRYTAILVQDGAFMVTVPYMTPDTEPLPKNPVYLYMWDHFQKPYPFQPDIIAPIDDVVDKKLDALIVMTSQFAEWMPWHGGYLDEVPDDPAATREFIRQRFDERMRGLEKQYRQAIADRYGLSVADATHYVEAFEICEYGAQPTPEEIRRLFPFLPEFKGKTGQ